MNIKSNEEKRSRVAVYCRVSTREKGQLESLENQISSYRERVETSPAYCLAEIYYDSGMSGYKENRPGFLQMLEDGEKGKFDVIVTKSVTRFARNTATVLRATRQLKKLGIGVYFELQEIYTLSQKGEILLTLLAAFAQAESENARLQTQQMIQRKYEKGQPPRQLQRCLGYKKDEYSEFVPDENAWIVEQIFQLAAKGKRISEITRYLNETGIKTQNGKFFRRCSVSRILHNNAYIGEFTGQRYYVNEQRKLVRNRGEKPMYHMIEDHVPIISMELWNAAQDHLKSNSKKPKKQLQKNQPGSSCLVKETLEQEDFQ